MPQEERVEQSVQSIRPQVQAETNIRHEKRQVTQAEWIALGHTKESYPKYEEDMTAEERKAIRDARTLEVPTVYIGAAKAKSEGLSVTKRMGSVGTLMGDFGRTMTRIGASYEASIRALIELEADEEQDAKERKHIRACNLPKQSTRDRALKFERAARKRSLPQIA